MNINALKVKNFIQKKLTVLEKKNTDIFEQGLSTMTPI